MTSDDDKSPAQYVDELRRANLATLESAVREQRLESTLENFDGLAVGEELVQEAYEGRYAFELTQNADDAASADGAAGGRVRFILTDEALIVADQGAGFGTPQVKAICGLGRSSKDPNKSIGYKGLGFKSVKQISSSPQIFAPQVQFGFDRARVREKILDITKRLPDDQKFPEYRFPFRITSSDCGTDGEVIDDLLEQQKFRTVVRLPLNAASESATREQVEHKLSETLRPELLLFLSSLNTLEVSGTVDSDFTATVTRERAGDHVQRVTLLRDSTSQGRDYLVYRREIPTVSSIMGKLANDKWKEVTKVRLSAAVPLDSHLLPCAAPSQKFHVYFPTDQDVGLPFLLSADFQLEASRKRIASDLESAKYNEWIVEQLADFLVDTVLDDLIVRFNNHPSVTRAFTYEQSDGRFSTLLRGKVLDRLRDKPYVPCIDGQRRSPSKVQLMPNGMPEPEYFHNLLIDSAELASEPDEDDCMEFHRLIDPTLDADGRVHAFLEDNFGSYEIPADDVCTYMRPPADAEKFYSLLLRWCATDPVDSPSWLRHAECVRTQDGSWRNPGEVFFPGPQGRSIDFAAPLHIPFADVPEIEGLRDFLIRAGVSPFGTRELIRKFVLPALREKETSATLREAALDSLRQYWETEGHDQEIASLVGGTLLSATGAGETILAPARQLYFGDRWLPGSGLTKLYGHFGRAEFLGEPPPEDQSQLTKSVEFFKWIGVQDKPRLIGIEAGLSTLEQSWRQEVTKNDRQLCPRNHAQASQGLRARRIDRFGSLVESSNWEQLLLLWNFLDAHWTYYQPAMSARWECITPSHYEVAVNQVISPTEYLMKAARWVPALRGSQRSVELSAKVWHGEVGSSAVRKALLALAPQATSSSALPQAAGLIDADQPGVDNLIELLTELRASVDDKAAKAAAVEPVATWAMQKLSRIAKAIPDDKTKSIPLMAQHSDSWVFDIKPFTTKSPVLLDIWKPELPICLKDGDVADLLDRLNLPDLDRDVVTQAGATAYDESAQEQVAAQLAEAKPYLLALATKLSRGSQERVTRSLGYLRIECVQDLVIQYRLGDKVREQYPSAHIEPGRISLEAPAAIAYLKVIDSAAMTVDWFSFAQELAHATDLPNIGADFAIVLTCEGDSRGLYLKSRRVSEADIDRARESIQALPPLADVTSDIAEGLLEIAESSSAPAHVHNEERRHPPQAPRTDEQVSDGQFAALSSEGHHTDISELKADVNSLTESTTASTDSPESIDDENASAARIPLTAGERTPSRRQPAYEGIVRRPRRRIDAIAEGSHLARAVEADFEVPLEVDRAGIAEVLRHERLHQRVPVEMPFNNEGYDIESTPIGSSVPRIIEVKSTIGPWSVVKMSSRQVRENAIREGQFWLYVVAHATSDKPHVIEIQNPIARADFLFYPETVSEADTV